MIPSSAQSILGLHEHSNTSEQNESTLCRVLNDDDPIDALNASDSSNLISLDLRTPPRLAGATLHSSFPAKPISENRLQTEQVESPLLNTSQHEFDPLYAPSSDELLAGIGRSRTKHRDAISGSHSGNSKQAQLKNQGAHYMVSGLSQHNSPLSMFELVKLAKSGRIGPLDIVCHVQGRSERAIHIPALREHFLARKSTFSSRLRSNLLYLSFLTCCSVFVWFYLSGTLTMML